MVNRHHFIHALVSLAWLAVVPATTIQAQSSESERTVFFESKIRPLLAERCWKCHSGTKQSGQLRLDSLQHVIDGGESGPAVVPGDVDGSLLLQAVRYQSLEMPPDQKLSDDEIQRLQQWVKLGAIWSNQTAVAANKRDSETVTEDDRQWWAFQPIVRPDIADPTESNPIDAIVMQTLATKGLQPAPPATRQQLIRRVYFDLIGLPPSIDKVHEFCSDQDSNSFDRLVDELLDRFEYGERWGRHWLDVVRFAQTNGYERDDEKPFAWRYRDYVIRSFNEDKPYDQFVREQLAGDEMNPVTDATLDATGFFRLGVWDDEPDDPRQAEFDALDDILSTTGTAFLGLSIGCARCHAHKFDPLPQEDYYRMLAFFRNVKAYQKPAEENASIFRNLPSGSGHTLAVTEQGREVPATHVLVRGDSGNPGAEVSPGFPRVFFANLDDSVAPVAVAATSSESSGRRSELARWITSPDNPLTARVIVNRLWQHHFGIGLVETPSDFGKTGSPPSHPDLLDFLAAELIANDWRLKPIHKLILTSKTWQQTSAHRNPLADQIDPGNRFLWRQNLRRLEAETIRDCVLCVAGTLNQESGGRGFFPSMPAEILAGQSRPGHGWDDSDQRQRNRRSVYVFAKRGITDPLLEAFDVATTDQTVPARTATTVAPQALTLLNSRFIERQASAAADHLIAQTASGDSNASAIRLWQQAFSRTPSADELEMIQDYYQQQFQRYLQQPAIISLRQAVPTSLHTPVLNRRKAEELLEGPSNHWQYSKGLWNDIGDEIYMVQMSQTPAALYSGLVFDEGSVRGRLQVDGQPDALSIAVGASIEQDLLQATEFVFNGVDRTVSLRNSGSNGVDIQTASFDLQPHQWIQFEIMVDANRISLKLNQRIVLEQPANELRRKGHLAVRCWGAGVSIADLQIETAGEIHQVGEATSPREPERAGQKALAALCNLVFNLNEFIYVD